MAVPCTTATFTEYGRHLMARGLKVSTIKNCMSRIRTAMPPGKKPDNSLYLRLLANYRKTNKRALRVRQAFPLTLPYVVPMMEKAEADGRPIGIRDAAMFAFGYLFLGRSIEDVDLIIEDLTVMDDRVVVWLAEDKTHKERGADGHAQGPTGHPARPANAPLAGLPGRAGHHDRTLVPASPQKRYACVGGDPGEDGHEAWRAPAWARR
ncbi:hypothetical protein [Streptomyces thermoalcalitolerans]|uniref:Uncharacterized protein n=1 Tax=Streptomyces thermoalcalitolerans TaxID=65605 RepID=A0ABP3Z6J5_9ACTN